MLQLFSIFHLNLAYSSIEEAQRPDVVHRCYWPLVRLIERTGAPIGIEASGFTLETAAAIDPAWLRALRDLVSAGRCEFVASGYAQIIGPLVPAAVNAANLRLGHEVYQRLLGVRPRLAFVNEQAYSAGLIQHYLDARSDAIVMEWDNPARAHAEWNPGCRYFPQMAAGQHGETIPLIWNTAIAFQQFQRYAHDEASLDEYLSYLGDKAVATPRVLAMYGNDAEIFDFRPGRYHTEAPVAAAGEWNRINTLFDALQADPRFALIPPSGALALMDQPDAGQRLHLESASDPAPVKKQRKYNITRWAVTGRDSLAINTACWRRYAALTKDPGATDAAWRELCELWSSDYRTHITDARWAAYRKRLDGVARAAVVARGFQPSVAGSPERLALQSIASGDPGVTRDGAFLTLKHGAVTLVLNCRRGLAIHALSFEGRGDHPLCGTLPHGFYDDIHWGADFYSGMTVMESPGRPKITDLNRVEPVVGRDDQGALVVEGAIATDLGPVVKRARVTPSAVDLEYRLEWPERPVGSLRLGDVTLHPSAFDRSTLFYRSHNGGARPETFPLDGTRVSHGDAVSFLVSASHAVGITEGVVELGDRATTLRIEVDKTLAAVVGMVTYQPVGDRYFCRISFSAGEVDDTRKPAAATGAEPLVCRFRITAQRA
ncbi:MAG: glycoside hydrolase family 57 [Acidobacteriia bacterium]|nr:glycoside hydrolase family 57 [Terriglobia bacterium]